MRFARILIYLWVVFIASPAVAGSFWTQLNSRNIDSQPLTFKVKTEKTPQGGVLFYVYIESKKAVLSRNLGASLSVTSGRKEIVRVDLEKKDYDKGVRFNFEISPRYLAESKFQFKDIEGPGDVYWFFLKDLSNDK